MLDAIVAEIPVIVKSSSADGRRLVEVEASCEAVDSEGDVILQKALLDSADYFVSKGHFDIDHYSELGARIGIPNPSSYIIGRPTKVVDLGKGRTGVVGEIMKAKDGTVDAAQHKYDEFWESLQSDPPVRWQASIYGFPKADKVEDCRDGHCDTAWRFIVKGIEWRSLAFTRNPINTSLKGHAKIVTAKAYIAELLKAGYDERVALAPPRYMLPPRSTHELWGMYDRHIAKDCPFCGTDGGNSRALFKDHFRNCCMMDEDTAELYALALTQMVTDESKRRH